MVTLSSWPDTRRHGTIGNQYIALYERALAAHGIALGPAATISNRFLDAHHGQLDAIQIQWVPEQIWRAGATSAWQEFRRVIGLWSFLRLAHRYGMKVLWTFHDVAPQERPTWVDRLGFRALATHADLCIVHDGWAARQFREMYPRSRADVRLMEHGNYDGVFPAASPRAETLRRIGIDPSKRVLLCQGLVRPYKRFDLSLEAAELLGDGYHLIVAGAAPDQAYAHGLSERAARAGNVTLMIESLPAQLVSDLFAACDCYVLPYQQITGSGAALTTATLGRGFVASNLPYFQRIAAIEPDAVVLHHDMSAASVAAAVREFFARDPETRHRAARRIADRVPWTDVVMPVIDWFDATFPGRRPASPPVSAG
jgi:glycosyltransferase involved in cell wall biosynthesis